MDYPLLVAGTEDIPDLVQIEYELFPENNFGEKTLAEVMAQGVIWLCHVDEVLAGYATCRVIGGKMVDLMRLGVRPHFRCLGIGQRLLRAALSLSGHTMLCVKKANDPAIRLYRRHGFEITGSLPHYESWTMELKTS